MQPHEPYYPAMPYLGALNSLNDENIDSHSAALRDYKYGAKKITPFQIEELRTRYDENLLDVDAQISFVLNALKENGLDDKTAIIITADHGEAFWEHGALTHNNQVYDEMVRIPLIIHLPGNVQRIETSFELKSTTDIYPAICALLGVPIPEHLGGIKNLEPQNVFSQPLAYCGIYGTDSPKEAFIFERYKLVKNDVTYELEVYDLLADKHEKNNLALTRPLLAQKLLAEANWWKQKEMQLKENMGWEPEPFVKPEQDHSKELEALGYF
jgi:arylsulfatase A-like enzyme